MKTNIVLVFLGMFVLAIGQAIVRRKLNPYGEVEYAGLPADLRQELERILPSFQSRVARITKNRDEARIEGDYRGEALRVEAEFDREGRLVELEAEVAGGFRTQGTAAPEDLPESSAMEIARVLGPAASQFERRIIKQGTARGQDHFEVKGLAGDWKWEVAVSADGQLLEFEKEKRRRGR